MSDFEAYNDTSDDFDDVRSDVTDTMERKAKAAAREKNKSEWNVSIKMVGNVKMVGGVTFDITGFGVYDGKYIVDEAVHKIGGGYDTTVKAHRVLEGY